MDVYDSVIKRKANKFVYLVADSARFVHQVGAGGSVASQKMK